MPGWAHTIAVNAAVLGGRQAMSGRPTANAQHHHHTMINQPGGVRVSVMERSSDQIIQPVHTKALTDWVGSFPKRLLRDMDQVAPMLRWLGYDPEANPPKYGEADPEILNNTRQVMANREYWEVKREQMLMAMKKPEMDYNISQYEEY